MTQIITNSELFKFKSKILDNTYNGGIINAKIAVLLKYLSNFWRTLEMKDIMIVIEKQFLQYQIQKFMFLLYFYQLKIIQNYCDN